MVDGHIRSGRLQKDHDSLPVRIAVRTIATMPALIAAGSCLQNSATIAKSWSGTGHGCAGGCAFMEPLVFRAFSRYPVALPSWLLWVRVPSPALNEALLAVVQIAVSLMVILSFNPSGLVRSGVQAGVSKCPDKHTPWLRPELRSGPREFVVSASGGADIKLPKLIS
jgi:hypothetical protein